MVEWAEVLGKWETWKQAKMAGVLIVQRGAERVKRMVVEKGWQVTVVGDEEGKISKALNACFVPRAYGFKEGKLVWLQKDPKMGIVNVLENFLRIVKGEKETVKLLNLWSAEMRNRAWGKATVSLVENGDGK